MAIPNLILKVMVARCARCTSAYTVAEWLCLRLLGRQELGGHHMELRTCACGTTLTAELVEAPVAPVDNIEARLRNRIAALEADLEASQRHGAQVEAELERKSRALWNIRRAARAANQAPPNPPGSVVVLRDFDPADPSVVLKKAGGR